MVLSVTLVVPIPGLRSAARAGWTLYFLARTQLNRLFHKGEPADRTAGNIHTPLVALISLVPLFGGAAYLACKPLRRKVLIRLALDQMASVLPFRAYERFRLQRWLAPPVLQNGDSGEDCVLDG